MLFDRIRRNVSEQKGVSQAPLLQNVMNQAQIDGSPVTGLTSAASSSLTVSSRTRLKKTNVSGSLSRLWQRRTLTIQMDSGLARIVIFKGRNIESWQTINFEDSKSLDSSQSNDQGSALSSAFKPLKASSYRTGSRVVLGMPTNASIIRRFTIRKVNRRYLKQIILSELQDSIPFKVEATDVFWNAQRTASSQEVFVVATPKKTTDGQVQPLKESGLKPSALFAKAQAMAHAVGHSEAIAVDLGRSWADIVLIEGGNPAMTHHTEMPNDNLPDDAMADSLARSIEQISTYIQAKGDGTGNEPIPVFLMGCRDGSEAMLAAIRARLDRQTSAIAIPMDVPTGFPLQEYAVNIGLALADWSRSQHRRVLPGSMGGFLDILPERHRPTTILAMPTAVFASLLVLGFLTFPIVSIT